VDFKVIVYTIANLYLLVVLIDPIGFVVSDWGATHDTTQDNANAGLDME
jgi:hypothetical protein